MPDGSRVSTAKPLFGVSDIGTGPSAVSTCELGAQPRVAVVIARHRPSRSLKAPRHGQRQLSAIAPRPRRATHRARCAGRCAPCAPPRRARRRWRASSAASAAPERQQLRARRPTAPSWPRRRRHDGTSVPRDPAPHDRRVDAQRARHLARPEAVQLRTASRYAGTVTIAARRPPVARPRVPPPSPSRPPANATRPPSAIRPPAGAQAADVPLDERVGAGEQRLVLGVALDHVGQVAQVVDQELDGALAPLAGSARRSACRRRRPRARRPRGRSPSRRRARATRRRPDLAQVGGRAAPAAARPCPRRTRPAPWPRARGRTRRSLSTSASAPQWPASCRAIENQKFRTSSGRGNACTKATYSAIVFFSSSMAMSSTSRMVARRDFRDRIGIDPS